MTNTGINLLSPGHKPKTNMQFLSFLVCTLKAVYTHHDLLQASIVSASNSLRLGANEAPPLIMSVFVGNKISEMLDELEVRVTSKKMTPDEKTELKLDVGKIPEILLDNTDRNRTSPFAFTGNRFEFRAVGSSANSAAPMTVLNSAIAQQLIQFKKDVDALIDKGVKKDEAIFQIIRKYIIDSKKIRFEGNSYNEDWHKEAKKRGLTYASNVIEALDFYLTTKSRRLFKSLKVMNEKEIEGRTDVRYNNYSKKIQIESRVIGDIAKGQIIPTALTYQTRLLENVKGLKEIFGDEEFKTLSKGRMEIIREISDHVTVITSKVNEMVEARKVANNLISAREKALEYALHVFPFIDEIRYQIDKLEQLVDNEIWPLPKYRELLFSR